ncbi:Thioredoxin domain-containing protein [Pyrolobus fumarii 1A]|uniref:Thioredoxin domain-containing protein n=1 Tax=Pyrolobus fumarii (strain DSM 11204 / 1A) TaxID=694429 RepID=G0ECS1_PYRF1|nr:thioredoxin family protein [Pyrolobus fumarii]AEM39641.1 Thioredoxin domain-containing protein [Pyrolobus fumarii 1A]
MSGDMLGKLRSAIEERISLLEKLHGSMVAKLTSENFTRFLEKHRVTVVLFTAPWCQPCKAFEPLFEIIARRLLNDERYKDDLGFGKVDTESDPQLADKYNVDKIPTVIIYYKGNVADVIVGAVTEEELVRRILNIAGKK